VHLAEGEINVAQEIEPRFDEMGNIEGGPQPDEAHEDFGPEAVGHGLGEEPYQGQGQQNDAGGVKGLPGPVEMVGHFVGHPDHNAGQRRMNNFSENYEKGQIAGQF